MAAFCRALIVLAGVVTLAGTASAARPPVLQVRNVSYNPGSGAVVDLNLKTRITYSITVTMGGETKTFAVRKSNALALRACAAADTLDVWVVIAETELWEFAAAADRPNCKARHIEFLLAIDEPAPDPADATPYERPLDVTVNVGNKSIARGRYIVRYRWDANASYRVWDTSFDDFFNTCLKGPYEIWADSGRLYCDVPNPAWYVTIKKRS